MTGGMFGCFRGEVVMMTTAFNTLREETMGAAIPPTAPEQPPLQLSIPKVRNWKWEMRMWDALG